MLSLSSQVRAEIFVISPPGTCANGSEFESVANDLEPGDELILQGGEYCQTGSRTINVKGTAAQPITIRAADGETPVLTRPDDPTQPQTKNGIEIYGEYLVIRGIRFTHGDTGVRFKGGSHHVTFEQNEISHTANNLMTLNDGPTDSFVIRHNHLHHSGLLDSEFGGTEGEGMYVGSGMQGVIASNHLIEGNYVHHLRSTSGGGNDGIEVKFGSYGNIVRDNVIHDTTIGKRFPCIFVYGVKDANANSPNIVEGNVMWNCGEAIQVASDAVIRNNLVLNSDVGITASSHNAVPGKRNVTIVNNTFYGHADDCLYIRWNNAENMLLANNAVYCPGGQAVDANGLSGPTVTVKSNYIEGSGATIDNDRFFSGGSAADAFLGSADLDFWPAPGSVLLGNALSGFAPALDFNGTARTSPIDVGAYETEGLRANPGWKVAAGFKDIDVLDDVPPPAPTGLQVE